MNRTAISLIIWTIVLILAQVIVFNLICLFGYAVAFVFLFTLVKLPLTLPKEWLFTIAFALGLVIDIFSDTLGMNALSSTLIMAVRRPIVRLYVIRDDELSDPFPGYSSFGTFPFIKYVLTFSLIYCAIFFMIEYFMAISLTKAIIQILSSAALTSILLIGIESLTVKKSEKRL